MTSAACAARGTPVEAPVDLTIAPIVADAGPPHHASATSDKPCVAELHAARVEKSSPGCVLDEQISLSTGYLRYPCTGDGPIEADFGAHHYTGALLDGEVKWTPSFGPRGAAAKVEPASSLSSVTYK